MINLECLSRAPVMTKSKQMLLILHKAVVNQHTRHRWLRDPKTLKSIGTVWVNQ